MLAKFIAQFSIFVCSVALSIMVLMFGWGLEVQSWGWILFGCFLQIVLLAINLTIAKEV